MTVGQEYSAGCEIPFSDEELFARGPQPTYTGESLRRVAFPLGGIGAGCISMAGRGALVDWEIFNRPNKGFRPRYAFFSLFARQEGGEPVFRVLEGRLQPPFEGDLGDTRSRWSFGFGPSQIHASGLLRMAQCSFTGYFPFCRVDLSDEAVPVEVSTEAWSPFIPRDTDSSSLPVAVFDITVSNVADGAVEATVALAMENLVGWPELGENVNEWVEGEGWRGIAMRTQRHEPDSPRYGTMALLTPHEDVTFELCSDVRHSFQVLEELVDGFGATGRFSGPRQCPPSPEGEGPIGKLGLRLQLQPGEQRTVTLVLAWLMPNFEKYWGARQGAVWETWHGRRWEDALEVASSTVRRLGELGDRTRRFADALLSSTLPTYVLDAISSQASILRTPTVTRLPDGTLYGWEGCRPQEGCCEGSCTHVWTYAQTVAYLFPELERGMREMDYQVNLRESDGHMQFRMPLPPGAKPDHRFHAAVDGQMGGVLRTYREWLVSGDDEWLEGLWPSVRTALEYAWVEWDADRDGLLEGAHHNTLDIEYHGPNTMCGSMYLAALRAAEEMARHVGDHEVADEYREVFESGRWLSDERLFNGEYYQQIVTDPEAAFQFGPGCIIDQVLGQWHARMYGLGDILDPEHVHSALAAVFRHNFRRHFFDHHNTNRVFALNDDMGTLICTWPRGGKPEAPVRYAHECMCGFEYQVGAHMIYEGMLREGLTVCKAIRDRFDGIKRNPWNEFECGSHYARSMANYAYLLALSGFRYDARSRTLCLQPRIFADDFHCFFSVEDAWGVVSHARLGEAVQVTVKVAEGRLPVERVVVGDGEIGTAEAVATPDEPLTVTVQ
ncbi:MAG: GH116 family glycosyl-hydrolase [Armatimonadota bacterium]|nr:GH116 family glycosyl-hydrolase [Armatimonadota bacterium]